MEVIWSSTRPMLVSAVVQRLEDHGRDLSHSTVKAVLNNLVGKRLLKKAAQKNATSFRARITKQEFDREVVSAVLAGLRRNYGEPVIAQLVEEIASNDTFLDEIEALIAKRRAKKDAAVS